VLSISFVSLRHIRQKASVINEEVATPEHFPLHVSLALFLFGNSRDSRNSFGQIIYRTTCHHPNCSPPQPTMKVSLLSCSLLACISPLVSATALTYKLSANEKACFFSNVENKGAKIAFYFAVSIHRYIYLPMHTNRYQCLGPSRRFLRC
jgi:hypothetical protein